MRIPRWADALWLALLTAYILAGTAIVPFHGDESTLIHMSQDYHLLFVEGDLSKILYDRNWSEQVTNQRKRLLNGTISTTIYGWLAWKNGFRPEDLNGDWRWDFDYEFNSRENRVPDRQLLAAARMASALQLALAGVIFFQVVQITLNRPTAYVASFLFALHPNVLINGRRAMMEGSHLLGLMLVLLAGAWLLRERRWWAYLLLGICMGFAVAAKHPNIIACALVYLALLLATLRRQRRKIDYSKVTARRELAALAAPLVVAAAVFLLLNPAWWSAPLELPRVIVNLRAALLEVQVRQFGGYNSIAESFLGIFQYVFAPEHQYYEVARWAEFDEITAQISAYESSGLAGLLIGGTVASGIVLLTLAAFGAVDLARNPKVSSGIRSLLLLWMGGTTLVTVAITPLPWARYYLPLAPAVIILVSHAVFILVSSLWNRARSRADGVNILD